MVVAVDTVGHECSCGHRMRWPGYVYGHWYERLTVTCEAAGCGKRIAIKEGRVVAGKAKTILREEWK